MKYLTFVIIALTARVYIAESECWFPMVCNGIPHWAKMETTCHPDVLVAEMKKLMKNDLDGLTDQTTYAANKIKDLEKKLELLKSRKSANIPPKSTVKEVEATTDSDGTTEIETKTTLAGTTVEVATQTTIVDTTGSSPCTYTYNSTLCYWVEWTSSVYVDAVKICENQGSEIGQIYNKKIYDEVMNILVENGWPAIEVWIALKIDTKTGEPTYPSIDAFTMWCRRYPVGTDGRINVVMHVDSYSRNPPLQCMRNTTPEHVSSTLCQVRTG